MSRGVARLGDSTIGDCKKHGPNIPGKIITASSDVTANNRPAARIGDKVKAECGCESPIVTAKGDVTANDRGIARIGDMVGGPRSGGGFDINSTDPYPYRAEITTGSSDTLV